jgi:hypothetical protein
MIAIDHPSIKNLVEPLVQERLDRKITHRAMAALLERRSTVVWLWESYRSAPNLRSLVVWADALGFEVVLKKKKKTAS